MKIIPTAAFLLLCLISTASDKPNIILFLVDDMGVMDTSVPFLTDKNGKQVKHPLNRFYKTPGMEKLASQGIIFSQFYANSVCSPTRATLMSGQSSARHHVTQFIKPETNNAGTFGPKNWKWEGTKKTDITLPKILSQNGYRTIHCGKAHFAPVGYEGEYPQNIGFDINIAGCAYGQPGSYYGKDHFGHAIKKRKNRAVPGLDKYHGKDIHLTEALTLELNSAISDSVKANKPFFAYMSHYAVHAPFQSDNRFAKNYKDSNKSKNAQAYATMIEGMDKSLRDIMAHLKKLNVAENTLIIFLGDNGSDAPLGGSHTVASSAPLRGKKGTHYEGGMRVPFIAAWASAAKNNPHQVKYPITPSIIHDEFAKISDIFPTILEMTSSKMPDEYISDGTSLTSYFKGKKGSHPQSFLMHFPHSHRSSYFTSLRMGKFKLVYHYKNKNDKRYELFDLEKDPFEEDNISAGKPEVLTSMIKSMQSQLKQANAQYPLDDDKATPLKPE